MNFPLLIRRIWYPGSGIYLAPSIIFLGPGRRRKAKLYARGLSRYAHSQIGCNCSSIINFDSVLFVICENPGKLIPWHLKSPGLGWFREMGLTTKNPPMTCQLSNRNCPATNQNSYWHCWDLGRLLCTTVCSWIFEFFFLRMVLNLSSIGK